MNKQELKTQIKNNVIFKKPEKLTGQHTGRIDSTQTLISEEMSVSISIGYHRSVLRNKELCLTLFDLVLDDLIK